MDIAKILVPVMGTEANEEAMNLAFSLAKESQDVAIYAVHVISIARDLPLDAEVESEIVKGEDVLASIERLAQEKGFYVETELLQARDVGPAIVDEAVERNVDIIIIGLNYKTKFGEFCVGDTVPYVLCNAPCRVIIYRQPSLVEEE